MKAGSDEVDTVDTTTTTGGGGFLQGRGLTVTHAGIGVFGVLATGMSQEVSKW